FIPMIMGLGCNVPAIMATRIIDSKFQRFLTILLIPLVSCAARLPVLVLLCGTFFPNNPSLWMFLLFSVNIGVILLLGHFSNVIFKAVENSPFLLEMPPYRLPTFKSVLDTLKEKAWHFIEKAGTVILAGTIIIWVLSSFPRDIPLSFDYEAEKALIMSVKDETKKQEALESLDSKRELEYMENRYMAKLGKAIHPIMEPLGFTWRETVSLIPGFLAKESVVSTLTVLYLPFSSDLGEAMTKSGITPLSAFVFMLFTLLYIPCLATFGVMWRESGSLKFTASSLFIYFIIAYLASFIAMKVGELMQTADGIALENILIVIFSIIAAWYLINLTISSISGKMCNSCSACSGCPSKTENCKGGCHK
ncbi:MAG: nucleoside recognition domain-containing protein, partial [Candidatus Riflebacteria bacterium]